MIRPMLKKILTDMLTMETYIEKECQDIDYTSVRPAQLSNNKSKGTVHVTTKS